MKLLFSESIPDYSNYQFPYVIWAIPDQNEPDHKMYEYGFMPSKGEPPRYYLSRSVRVVLSRFSLSSENNRIIRKGADISLEIIPINDFDLTDKIVRMCLNCATNRFGLDVMSETRFREIFHSKYTSHILQFSQAGNIIGLVTALIKPPEFSHYNFAFYDLDAGVESLGMFMMTSAIVKFSSMEIQHVYLGSCYSRRALYKTQFKGCEFFNGVLWSQNLKELKYLIDNNEMHKNADKHLLESTEYINYFSDGMLDGLVKASKITIK